MSEHDPRDLLGIALGGVQTYITEARSTTDAAGASDIMAHLGRAAATHLNARPDVELVLPTDPAAASSRVIALVPPGTGAAVAGEASQHLRAKVREWTREVLGTERDIPGFPEIRWTAVPAGPGGYARQWEISRVTLEARKASSAFSFPEQRQGARTRPCAVSPRWPAEREAPANARGHEESSEFSAAVWLKRLWLRNGPSGLPGSPRRGFPSTASIASSPYRARILDRWDDPGVRDLVDDLERAARTVMGARSVFLEGSVPALDDFGNDRTREWFVRGGGWWVTPGTWNSEVLAHEYGTPERPVDTAAVARGRETALALEKRTGSAADPYYAILAADLDGLGDHLSAPPVTPERHESVSRRLTAISKAQKRIIEREHSGITVYSGGDDLLAFLPAAHALEAARSCRAAVGADPTTLSCAVLFAHQGAPLHTVIARARTLLDEAKSVPGKDALTVGYITGSGSRAHTVRPWSSACVTNAADSLSAFTRPAGREPDGTSLSPRLVNDLHRSRAALANLAAADRPIYEAEVTRLIRRHGGTRVQVRALLDLGGSEHAAEADLPLPLAAARVAVFLGRRPW